MEIKIKFTKDEIAALVKDRLNQMFPDQTFRVGQEYYGSPGWQAELIQPEDDDAIPLPLEVAGSMNAAPVEASA